MFEVFKEIEFSAAHHLRDYIGKCEHPHGHNWRVRLYIRGASPLSGGMLIDFGEIKKVLREVTDRLDHKDLNEVPPFDHLEPSSELLAKYIAEESAKLLDREGAYVHRVDVWETRGSCATYIRDDV